MPYVRIESYIVSPESVFRHVYPNNGLHFTAAELVALVSGHIRIITLKGEYKGKVLVVTTNAEGKKLNLQQNPIASQMAGRKLYGDALVCERHLIK